MDAGRHLQEKAGREEALAEAQKAAKHAKPENKNILAETRRREGEEGRSEIKMRLNRCVAGVTPDERNDRLFLFPFSPFVLSPVETLFICKVRRSALRVRDSSARTDPPRGAGCLANQSQTSRRHRP